MTNPINQKVPKWYHQIKDETNLLGFHMASDILTCSLLRSLAASKPSGKFLELGTGTGLSTSWILDGMDKSSTLTSIDNDPAVLDIAVKFLSSDKRASFILEDGEKWLIENKHKKFDYIFADTWQGKYFLLEETISMLKPGGFYIIDDMLPQLNWPEGHHEKVQDLISTLENKVDLWLIKLNWATGILIGTKKSIDI